MASSRAPPWRGYAGGSAMSKREIVGNRRLDEVRKPRDLADVDVAIARALLGVAETGSLLFAEEQ